MLRLFENSPQLAKLLKEPAGPFPADYLDDSSSMMGPNGQDDSRFEGIGDDDEEMDEEVEEEMFFSMEEGEDELNNLNDDQEESEDSDDDDSSDDDDLDYRNTVLNNSNNVRNRLLDAAAEGFDSWMHGNEGDAQMNDNLDVVFQAQDDDDDDRLSEDIDESGEHEMLSHLNNLSQQNANQQQPHLHQQQQVTSQLSHQSRVLSKSGGGPNNQGSRNNSSFNSLDNNSSDEEMNDQKLN